MRKRSTGPPRFLASETKVTLDPSPLSELSIAPVSAGPGGPAGQRGRAGGEVADEDLLLVDRAVAELGLLLGERDPAPVAADRGVARAGVCGVAVLRDRGPGGRPRRQVADVDVVLGRCRAAEVRRDAGERDAVAVRAHVRMAGAAVRDLAAAGAVDEDDLPAGEVGPVDVGVAVAGRAGQARAAGLEHHDGPVPADLAFSAPAGAPAVVRSTRVVVPVMRSRATRAPSGR